MSNQLLNVQGIRDEAGVGIDAGEALVDVPEELGGGGGFLDLVADDLLSGGAGVAYVANVTIEL